MMFYKIRKVGNSEVVSLPAWMERYGFRPGSRVVYQALESGVIRLKVVS